MTRQMHERTIAPSEANREYFDALTEQFKIRELIKELEKQSGTYEERQRLKDDLEDSKAWCKRLDNRRFENDENENPYKQNGKGS